MLSRLFLIVAVPAAAAPVTGTVFRHRMRRAAGRRAAGSGPFGGTRRARGAASALEFSTLPPAR